jgi:hypothetical protein
MTLVKVTVLIEEIPVIMTASNTIASKTVKRLKPNASHIERDIFCVLCCELVDDAPLAQGVEALLSFVLDKVVLRRSFRTASSASMAILEPAERVVSLSMGATGCLTELR